MNPDINEILDEALELEGEARDVYINEKCADKPELRAQIEQLIKSLNLSVPAAFMDGPIPVEDISLTENLEAFLNFQDIDSSQIKIGKHIADYRIVKRLGEGGMGEVYMAERDGEFNHRVAIKVVRSGMATEEGVKRFHYERQILATLVHPNIARFLFGGVTNDGIPYFVMEYIDGVPITTYCDNKSLSIRERVALFRDVCDAVRYAQRNMVIHRDLKPTNILVDNDQNVKLLDFGIAKLIQSEDYESPVTAFETTGHKAPFTPAYAAPEQVLGKPISAATDVYSLGMLFYELLTGRRAYELDKGWLTPENIQLICDHVPSAPSTIVTRRFLNEESGIHETFSTLRGTEPPRLRRILNGDLDAIVMRALKKEPGKRYGTAGELYEDIDHYLNNRPVRAQNDSFRYRTFKFVQRRKGLVLASSLGVLALIVGLIASLIYANEAGKEALRANITKNYLTNIFESVDPNNLQGEEITLDEIVELGLGNIDDLDDEPLVKAEIFSIMAVAYLNMGHFDKADSLYTLSIALYKSELGPNVQELTIPLWKLGLVKRNNSYFGEAEALLQEALQTIKGRSVEDQILRSNIESDLALIHEDQKNYPMVEYWSRKALDLPEGTADTQQVEALKTARATAMDRLATALLNQNKTIEAEQIYREVLETLIADLGPMHGHVANTLLRLGRACGRNGKINEAEQLFLRTDSMYSIIYEPIHVGVATTLHERGILRYNTGDYGEAERFFRSALDMFSEAAPEGNWSFMPSMYLGMTLTQLDQPEEARTHFEALFAIFKKFDFDMSRFEVCKTKHWLGRIEMQQSRNDEAVDYLQESMQCLANVIHPEKEQLQKDTNRYLNVLQEEEIVLLGLK